MGAGWGRGGGGAARLLGGGLLALAVGAGESVWGQEEVFVANSGSNSVMVYPRTASGDVTPLRILQGGATGLFSPQAVAVDTAAGELFAVNALTASVTVYSRTATGNVLPLRVIAGLATGLLIPQALVVDLVHRELVVANFDSITVYPLAASGNVAPQRTLQGVATGLVNVQAVLVDLVNDELIAMNSGNNTVTVYPRTATGNAPPVRTLVGFSTGLVSPQGGALDLVHDELLVANAGNSSITVYARTASGNAAPLRTIVGGATGLVVPLGLVLDLVNDELTAVSSGNNAVLVYPRTASGNASPTRIVAGGATGLTAPGLAAVTTSPPLLGAVLPVSRSVQVQTPASAFATMINAGPGPVQECAPTPIATAPPLPATYSFQTTDEQNQLTGAANTPASIPPGGSQNFVFVFTPTGAFTTTTVSIAFACDGTNPAAAIPGVTTLLLGASTTPGPDLIAVAATADQNGIVTIPGPAGTGAFAVATANLGATATIAVSADTGIAVLPLTILICQTVPATGECMAPPAPVVTLSIPGGAAPTFGIFAGASGAVPFDPAVNRIFVGYRENGVLRGATSVAVQTQ